MIRCETVNRPGGDAAAAFAQYRGVLEELFPLVHEKLERTLLGDAMVYRWRGRDPARGAVVLMSHSDVVPAEGEWAHPPLWG